MNSFDREHIGEIIQGHGDWFDAKLIRLIADAGTINRERLRTGFPEQVKAVEKWIYGPCVPRT